MRYARGALSDRCLPVACAMLLTACASAPRNPVLDHYPAGVTGRTTVMYYDVHGRTFEEVRGDMRRLGPKVDGTSFVGETRSPMAWTWRTETMGSSSCSIREVNVVVNAQITLPRWTPPPDTEPGLVAEWKRFIAALETHEAGHKDISAKAAHEIIEKLHGTSGPCSTISTHANDIARAIVERAHPNGLTINATDSSAHAMGDSVIARGTIGRLPVGELVDCGTPPAGRNADSVEVALFITPRLVPSEPSATTVTNTLHAVARPPDGAPVACRSRGVLERRLFDALRNQAAR